MQHSANSRFGVRSSYWLLLTLGLGKYLPLGLFIFLLGCGDKSTLLKNNTPVVWKVQKDGSRFSQIEQGEIFAISQYRNRESPSLTTANLSDGKIIWSTSALPKFSYNGIGKTFHVNYPYIYVQTRQEGFRVFNVVQKRLVKTVQQAPQLATNAWVAGNEKYLALASDNQIFLYNILDLENPILLWNNSYFNYPLSMTLKDDTLFFGLNVKSRENLFAVNANDGSVIWKKKFVFPETEVNFPGVPGNIIVEGDNLYFPFDIRFGVRAVQSQTGEEIWRNEAVGPNSKCSDDQGALGAQIAMAGDNIILTAGLSRCVFAFNKYSGKLAWVFDSKFDKKNSFSFCGRAVYRNGVVYVGNGVLWAIDNNTGEVLSLNPEPQDQTQCSALLEWNGLILAWGMELVAYKAIR